jgi:hypothetical protein
MAMRTPVNANRLPCIQSVNNYILCVCLWFVGDNGAWWTTWTRRQFLSYASFEGGGMSHSAVCPRSAGVRGVVVHCFARVSLSVN